ncbi:MAG: O-antigen ligase family protein [Chloroflexota bacterium]
MQSFDLVAQRFEEKRPFLVSTMAFVIALAVGLVLTQLPIVGILGNTAVFALLSTSPFLGAAVLLGLFLLILRAPIVGLGLALMAGPWGAIESLFLGPTPLDSGQLFLFLTLSAWLLRGLGEQRIVIPKGSFYWPLFLFIGVAFLSLFDAQSIQFGVQEMLKWIEMWLIIGLVLSESERAPSKKQFVQQLLLMFLLAGFVQALIGIWQFGLRGIGPAHFIISGNFYRAYGSFEQPNPFGGLMHLTALLVIGATTAYLPALWHFLKGSTHNLWQKKKLLFPKFPLWAIFLLVCGGTAVLSLLFSWSRGAWLGFAAGIGAIGLFWPQKRWIGFASLIVAVASFTIAFQLNLVPESIAQRLVGFVADFQLGDVRGVDINDTNYSVLERLAHWQAAVDMARDQLWLGVGFGNYEPAYAEYALINWPDPLGHAHNYYLNILAETGIIGLSAYLIFWIAVVLKTINGIQVQTGLYRGVLLGLLGCWAAISVHHLVDKLYVNNLYIQFGVLLSLLLVVVKERKEKKEVRLVD